MSVRIAYSVLALIIFLAGFFAGWVQGENIGHAWCNQVMQEIIHQGKRP